MNLVQVIWALVAARYLSCGCARAAALALVNLKQFQPVITFPFRIALASEGSYLYLSLRVRSYRSQVIARFIGSAFLLNLFILGMKFDL